MPLAKYLMLCLAAAVISTGVAIMGLRLLGKRHEPPQPATVAQEAPMEPVKETVPAEEKASTIPGKKDEPPKNPAYPVEGVYATGWVQVAGRLNVQLSDGSLVTETDPDLGRVTRAFATIAGRKVPFIARPPVEDKEPPRAEVKPPPIDEKPPEGSPSWQYRGGQWWLVQRDDTTKP